MPAALWAKLLSLGHGATPRANVLLQLLATRAHVGIEFAAICSVADREESVSSLDRVALTRKR